MATADLRAARRALQDEEDAVSFARRMVQGRIDLVADEVRRRAAGDTDPPRPVSERLAEVFGQEQGGGSARPPRRTEPPTTHELLVQLEQLCDEHEFASMSSLSDRALAELRAALEMFETMCSGRRRELFARIDELTAELVGRLRDDGPSSVLERPS
jgi:hypothetical protein